MADSATALRTIFTYPLSGVGPYTIAFDYLARKFVQVTLLGADRQLLVLGTNYRFSSSRQITLIGTIPPGYTNIEIRRFTDAQDRLVDFQDGSILRASDLNISQLQTMHIAEEGRDVAGNTLGVDSDGNLDARNRKMVNLTDGVLDGDAVTVRQEKSWSASAYNSAQAAKASQDAAAQSVVDAIGSQNAALSSAISAGQSATNASVSATQASQYRDTALSAAGSARQAETMASASATAASNSASAAHTAQLAAEAARDKALTANPDVQLKKANNLADVASIPQARVNLSVYSQTETNQQIGQAISDALARPAWRNATLENSWALNTPADSSARAVYRVLNGYLEIHAHVWKTPNATNGTVFTLPTGFRPAAMYTIRCVAVASDSTTFPYWHPRVTVRPTGIVSVDSVNSDSGVYIYIRVPMD